MSADEFVRFGKVVGVHGVNGVIKVYTEIDVDPKLIQGKPVRCEFPDNRPKKCFTVKSVGFHQRVVLFELDGLNSREMAKPLTHAVLFVRRSDLPALEADEYYWSDLIGLSVFSEDGTYLGQVTDIIATAGNDVYVIRDLTKDPPVETLAPAIASVVRRIDLNSGTMQIRPLEYA